MKNILGEYSSFFKPNTWNYLHVNYKNLYRNDRKQTFLFAFPFKSRKTIHHWSWLE